MKSVAHILFLAAISLLLGLTSCGGDSSTPQSEPKVETAPTSDPGMAVINQLSQKIEGTPNDPSLYAQRAEAYYQKEGYDEAIGDLQKALSMDSTNVAYLHLLADVYLDYYKSRESLETMQKAVRLNPDNAFSLLKLSEFQLILKKQKEALQTLDQLLRKDPQNAEAFFMMGRVFEDLGDENRAINSYQTAVENDPQLQEVWLKLGNLFAKKKNKIALRYFDSAIELDTSDINALFAKGNYLHSNGQLDEAIALYKKINRIDIQYPDSYYNAGLAYMEKDSIPKAYGYFDLAIKMQPTFALAYYYRGLSAQLQGKFDQARNDYQQTLNLRPDFERAQEGLDELQQQGKASGTK
ncbi:MAG: tetratricopeptide repeat protein [Bacteroidota bacterium]